MALPKRRVQPPQGQNAMATAKPKHKTRNTTFYQSRNRAKDDDLEQLKYEIENEKRMKSMLEQSISELEQTVADLETQAENADVGEEDEWKVRYYTQVEVNKRLERQREWLAEKVDAAKTRAKEGATSLFAELDLDSLTESQLLRYLKQLEKDRNGLYNELRDTEWKLDQESKAYHKYNDTRKAYMTEITDAMLNLEALRNRMRLMEMSETGSIGRCPRHMKYVNISPDHRVIDPRKGPIKKTAAVRSLPKLNTIGNDAELAEEQETTKRSAEV